MDHIRYRETPTNDDARALFYLGIDRFNTFGESAQVMDHPGKGLPRWLVPYREGIRCAQRGHSYSRALAELMR